MSTLLEKEIKVNRILTTSVQHARAIEDPARSKIIEILYHRALSADQISSELKKTGYKKALTTVRHHLDILKEAGLRNHAVPSQNFTALLQNYWDTLHLMILIQNTPRLLTTHL